MGSLRVADLPWQRAERRPANLYQSYGAWLKEFALKRRVAVATIACCPDNPRPDRSGSAGIVALHSERRSKSALRVEADICQG